MFSTFKFKLLIAAYVIIILSIPVGSYLVSQSQTIKSKASQPKPTPTPVTKITANIESSAGASPGRLDSTIRELLQTTPTPTPTETSTSTLAKSFGPTLSFKIAIEGRPQNNQSSKVFVGLVEGSLVVNPKFLLTFLVDVPSSGEGGNLSIAGLNPGSRYTALLKGKAQIASSSAFVMSPTESKLNSGSALNLISGDLNEDNVINTADYSIARGALSSTPTSKNWIENADFNKDSVINIFDISLILKNLGKVGDSGVWVSPVPTATPSGALTEESTNLPVGSTGSSSSGYWIWVPR